MKGGGLGLIGMKERISLVDGEFAIDAAPGAGTRIRAHVLYSPTPQANGHPS
jgi:signal transduction histidine kinase